MTTLPPDSMLAKNITRTIDALADEIARRVDDGMGCNIAARTVLLDWFCGDFIPSRSGSPATPGLFDRGGIDGEETRQVAHDEDARQADADGTSATGDPAGGD